MSSFHSKLYAKRFCHKNNVLFNQHTHTQKLLSVTNPNLSWKMCYIYSIYIFPHSLTQDQQGGFENKDDTVMIRGCTSPATQTCTHLAGGAGALWWWKCPDYSKVLRKNHLLPMPFKDFCVKFQENTFYFQAWLIILTADYMKTCLLEVLLRIILVSARQCENYWSSVFLKMPRYFNIVG